MKRDAKTNSRESDNCNVDVHRASYVKHLTSKEHLENERQKELIIPEWLFKEPFEYDAKNIYSPKPLKQIAEDKKNR